MNKIIITSCFGHEIMAVAMAKAFGIDVDIVPKKDNREDYEKESRNIFDKMFPFYSKLNMVPFEKRETAKAKDWDVIQKLKDGNFEPELWDRLASSKLSLVLVGLPEYRKLYYKKNVLFVPQKLKSDGECGVTAAQQSLDPELFSFMKGTANLVLGQHFHKENDLSAVRALAKEFDLYVPGMTENEEVFGIRGVAHSQFFDMYKHLSASVGIAGTHTWIMLTCFPEIPQIILFNKKGSEDWKAIEAAYQRAGYRIFCVGFDENTDKQELKKEIEEKYKKLF